MENQGRKDNNQKAAQAVELGITCVLLFFLAAAETTLMDSIRVFGAAPALSLIFCVCLSLRKEPYFAVFACAVCGVCLDLAKGTPIGVDCLLYTYISAGCIWLRSRFYFRKKWVIALCVFGWVLAYGFAASLIQSLLSGSFSIKLMFGSAMYSAALTWVLCVFLRRKEV